MPRAANVVTEVETKLITLDRRAFKRLLGPLQEYLKRNMRIYEKYLL